MSDTDTLIESISQQISDPASQNTTFFSTLDLKYACLQLNLDPDTGNHCNFNIISGNMTDTYSFQTGFYGLARLVDRIVPFQFDNEHMRGVKMGLVDHISRYPNQKVKKVSAFNEEFFCC